MLTIDSIHSTLFFKVVIATILTISSVCTFCIAYQRFMQGISSRLPQTRLLTILVSGHLRLAIFLLAISTLTLWIAICSLDVPLKIGSENRTELSQTPADSTTSAVDQPIAQKQHLLMEYFNTRIQANNDDASALMLYGTIPLGAIALLLPLFVAKNAPRWYWLALVMGTILLAAGAIETLSYSREQTAWSNRAVVHFFRDFVATTNNDSTVLTTIRQFEEGYPATFSRRGLSLKVALGATKAGALIYIALFIYGILSSSVYNRPFFAKSEHS